MKSVHLEDICTLKTLYEVKVPEVFEMVIHKPNGLTAHLVASSPLTEDQG